MRGVNGDGPGPWSSLAAAATLEKANSPATGEGIITGAARVAGTLAVDPSRIADEDGLENAVLQLPVAGRRRGHIRRDGLNLRAGG